MALQTTYSTGTATINAGETVVTGVGTGWMNFDLRPGDLFWAAGLSVRILSVDSNTQLTLAYPWPGQSRAAQSYEARVTPDVTRVLASARAVLDALTNGVLYAFSGLVGAADRLPYFTGAGTAALATFTAYGRSVVAAANAAAARTALQLVAVASSGSASDLTTGTLPDGRLPTRIQPVAPSITDADTALEQGRYFGWHGNTLVNFPTVNQSWTLDVLAVNNSSNIVQKAHRQLADTSAYVEYVRTRNVGVFGAWEQVIGRKSALDAAYAQIAGPTTDNGQGLGTAARRFSSLFTSAANIGGDTAAAAALRINGAAGTVRELAWRSAGITRASINLDSSAESGSNGGSNPVLSLFGDDGSYLGAAWTVARATRVTSFAVPPKIPSYTVATLPSASAYAQCVAYVSNGTTNKRLATSDGTNWRFPDGAIVS